MLYGLTQTVAPAGLPVTLAEARKQCDLRPDSTIHNAELDTIIRAASDVLGEMQNRQFLTAQYEYTQWGFQTPLYLPRAPLVSVQEIKWHDGTTYQTLDPAAYQVAADREPGYVVPVDAWPTPASRPDAINVAYTCGDDPVPSRFRMMILYLVRQYWEQKGPVSAMTANEVPLTLRTLIYNTRTGAELQCY